MDVEARVARLRRRVELEEVMRRQLSQVRASSAWQEPDRWQEPDSRQEPDTQEPDTGEVVLRSATSTEPAVEATVVEGQVDRQLASAPGSSLVRPLPTSTAVPSATPMYEIMMAVQPIMLRNPGMTLAIWATPLVEESGRVLDAAALVEVDLHQHTLTMRLPLVAPAGGVGLAVSEVKAVEDVAAADDDVAAEDAAEGEPVDEGAAKRDDDDDLAEPGEALLPGAAGATSDDDDTTVTEGDSGNNAEPGVVRPEEVQRPEEAASGSIAVQLARLLRGG